MRVPLAMRRLMAEIGSCCEDAMFETMTPDGYDVWRALVLDVHTTERLSPLLGLLDDERLAMRWLDDARGQYVILFVSDHRADSAAPFNLDKAYAVLFSRD